mmetsp:Transcript_8743/g.26501  ORF Transcript_8743/g.26501 Transcript_8743/m.26501 type:complete len:202 (+) Transcript_8743:614-1219(+)
MRTTSGCRRSTKSTTTRAWRSSRSQATSLGSRSQAASLKSRPSARQSTTCPSPCSARSTSTARAHTQCLRCSSAARPWRTAAAAILARARTSRGTSSSFLWTRRAAQCAAFRRTTTRAPLRMKWCACWRSEERLRSTPRAAAAACMAAGRPVRRGAALRRCRLSPSSATSRWRRRRPTTAVGAIPGTRPHWAACLRCQPWT